VLSAAAEDGLGRRNHARALGLVSTKNSASSGKVATCAPDFAARAAAAWSSSTAVVSMCLHAFLPLRVAPMVRRRAERRQDEWPRRGKWTFR
jgi:hypothetical protein